MISASQLAAAELHRQDLLTEAARWRVADQARQTRDATVVPPGSRRSPIHFAWNSARYALAALGSIAFGFSQN